MIEIAWYDEDESMMLYTFHGRWSWDEFYRVQVTGRAMADSIDHSYSVISDYRDALYTLPPNFIPNYQHIAEVAPRNFTGLVVYVQAGGAFRAIAHLLERVTLGRIKLHFADTVQEAALVIRTQHEPQR